MNPEQRGSEVRKLLRLNSTSVISNVTYDNGRARVFWQWKNQRERERDVKLFSPIISFARDKAKSQSKRKGEKAELPKPTKA